MNNSTLIELNNITKYFVNVKALENVNFTINKGEIVSLAGANGAGKSTFLKILYGIHKPDKGSIIANGIEIDISNSFLTKKLPKNLNIALVPQEPKLVPKMSVMENVFLNNEILSGYKLNKNEMKQKCIEKLNSLDYKLNPDELAKNLSREEKGVVSIVRALMLEPDILCLDEVTACLCKDEVERLFEVILELKNRGISIVFISHKINEITQISDRVTILRDGEKVCDLNKGQFSSKKIVNLMLGGKGYERTNFKENITQNEAKKLLALKIEDIKGKPERNCNINKINFKLFKGEILGLAGLKGSGVNEIFKILYGLEEKESGTIKTHINDNYSPKSPNEAMKNKVGLIPKDRHEEGLALVRDIKDNITINVLEKFCRLSKILKTNSIMTITQSYVNKLNIVTPSISQEVEKLSGGNQQKVLVAKWLLHDPEILLINEPTRGVDVKVKDEIYNILIKLKEEEKAILVHSPEVRELIKVCDRILLMSSGEIIEEVNKFSENFNENYILNKINS